MNRRVFLTTGIALAVTAPLHAQSFGQSQAAAGVREVLDQAARLATSRLGRVDGFWGDPQVRIPLPRTVSRLQAQLRPLGLSGTLDDLELGLNRAAENAMPAARDIFVSAVRNMSVSDAVGIVRGSETAATQYLRRASGPQLERLLDPPMNGAMRDAGVYRVLGQIEPYVDQGNSFLSRFGLGRVTTNDLAADVRDHAVERALDGVFFYVGEEERAIRRDPLGQASSILRQVFG